MKKTIVFFIILALFFSFNTPIYGEEIPPETSALSYILSDGLTGYTLCGKAPHRKLPMASTTKIMTVLLALESGRTKEKITFTREMIAEGSSIGLKAGDTVDIYTLCVGMMLASGNDAANAVALTLSDSIAGFCKMMNQKAQDLGMKNTSFETPSGLDGKNHFSTAYDMAILTRYAMKNPEFFKLACAKSMTVTFGNPAVEVTLTNHNKLLKSCNGAVGVKTGFTKRSGRCLVSMVQREGVSMICVTLNDPDDWDDHCNLYDYGIKYYSEFLVPDYFENLTLSAVGGTKDRVSLYTPKTLLKIPKAIENDLVRSIQIHPFVYAPVKKGASVGDLSYRYKDTEIYRGIIYTAEDVPALPPPKKPRFFTRLWNNIKKLLS